MKVFNPDKDVFLAKSLISEAQTIPRDVFSGSDSGSLNIANGFSSGSTFLVLYDKPATNEASHKICTVAYGYTTSSAMYTGSFAGSNQLEKLKIYRLFAQRLLGNPNLKFKLNGVERHELMFLSIYRNLYKDGISTDSNLKLALNTSSSYAATPVTSSFISSGKTENFFGGKATYLIDASTASNAVSFAREQGLLFNQLGIFVIDPLSAIGTSSAGGNFWSGSFSYEELAKGVSGTFLVNLLYGVRNRISNVMFSNTINIHSYFIKCVAEIFEFNYSSNPSFTNANGEIITTSGTSENLRPTTYITSVGLYNKNSELLAVARIKNPVKKDPETKASIYVRLSY